MKGFVAFLRKQGVVGLAVGFILGGAVSKLVSALVQDLINPLIGVFLGSAETLVEVTWQLGTATIGIGHFLTVLIDFAVIAAVVYFVFKGLGLDKLDKKD